MTTSGKISFTRTVMRPTDSDSKKLLFDRYGVKSIVPLDIFLGIDNLPVKMSVPMMIECAYWAQNQVSYQLAEEAIEKIYGCSINDDTIRAVTNFIGKLIYLKDCRCANEIWDKLESGKLTFPLNRNGVLYIETDGAALNTRIEDDDGSTWRENKLGIVFNSNDIYHWTGEDGVRHHQIRKRDYVSYIGPVAEFKKHLLARAVQSGYGKFKHTVLISDGAHWISNMAEEIFPDATHILDLFHLKENVYDYAKQKFSLDPTLYNPWASRICDMLENGEWQRALSELDPEETYPNTVNLHGYISFHKDHIDYPHYKENGWFVGSGAIESGNKVVMQKRMKQAGMRWNPETAQYLVTLCSKEASKSWSTDVAQYITELLKPDTESRRTALKQ